jgi:CheY-like chemotaxis protein
VNRSRLSFAKVRHRLLEHIVVPFFLLATFGAGGGQSEMRTLIDEIRKKRHTILVIDDDNKFRRSLCFMLKRIYSAQVDDVNSGLLALEKLAEGRSYDLILTDIMMPKMSGLEAYRELKKIDPHVKIVFMSAYSDSEEWEKAQQLGEVLLHKPILPDALIRILSDLGRA